MRSSGKFASIQCLRAVAAASIVLLHVMAEASSIAGLAGRSHPLEPIRFATLGAGVDLFFVISGFVMVHASQRLFGIDGGWRRFLAHRIARIVPLYWLTTTLFLLVGLVLPAVLNSDQPTAGQIAASYLFWPMTRTDGLAQPVYGLGWTLNYEMFFYALLAACMGFRRNIAVAIVGIALVVLVAAGPTLRPLGMPLAFWSDPLVLEFVVGSLIAMVHGAGWRLPLPGGIALATAGVALLVADQSAALPRVVAWGLPAGLLFAGIVLVERAPSRGWLGRALVSIGDASYALYLTHPFVIRPVGKLWLKMGLGGLLPVWLFIVAAMALSIWAAMLVFRWVESPLTAALNARLDRRGKARIWPGIGTDPSPPR